jgi:transposase
MDGLIHLVAVEMKQKPTDGSIYVFRNKSKDKLKVLIWDRNGFVLGYKRLETGRFDFPVAQNGSIRLNLEQMYLLISGLPMSTLNGIGQSRYRYFS